MNKYSLIALDVDGTALNDDKYLLPGTVEAVNDALEQGVEVIFCSGRSPAEMREYFAFFPKMRYFLGECGGLVYDLENEKPLFCARFDEECWRAVCEVAKNNDTMPGVYHNGQIYFNRDQIGKLAEYGQALYVRTLPPASKLEDDVLDETLMSRYGTEKFCIFHRSGEEREKSFKALSAYGLPLTMALYAETSLEVQPYGIDKGSAMEKLASIMGIDLSQTVMVGDSNNDLPALEKAGLSVAMGNSPDEIKGKCDLIVADNNNGGCEEAIRYVLEHNAQVGEKE